MLKDPGRRRAIAAIGIVLGVLYALGVVWSVLSGQAEWWSMVLLLPAALIVIRLYALWIRRD